ncbi:MAG: sugar ABC transporter substrate-binding protein [Bifidobacterium sp.]|uniref:ABC transporter substrate-binding protein n=1 Tax=Bifidobacterium sp. TaxID=41200 RepID=UPI0039E7E3F9
MRKEWLLRGIAALGSVGLLIPLAACGSSSASGDKVELTMMESLTTPVRTVLLKKLIKQFEAKNPDITVDLVSPPTDSADQTIRQTLQSGEGIDVLEVRDTTVGGFSTNGWLTDMSSSLEKWDGWGNLTTNAQNSAKNSAGKIWYLPYGFYGLSLYYRTDLIKQAGFSNPPTTWSELLHQASAIQDTSAKRYGYAFRGGSNADSNVVAAIEAYVAKDLDTTNAFKLKSGKTIFSSSEAQKAVDTYFKLYKQASPPSSSSWGYPEMVQGFSNGSTAFLLQDPEVIATLAKSTSIKESQWDTAPLLKGPSGIAVQPVATAGWGIAKSSQHQAAALKLVEFLGSDSPATTFAKQNNLVPIVKSALTSDYYKTGKWKAYATMQGDPEHYLNVTQPREVSWWNDWVQKSDSQIQEVLLGKLTTKELLSSWDQYWTQKWKA